MITGAHVMLHSADADADRAFLRDMLALHAIDAGGGWLVFAVPSTELSIHPGDGSGQTEFSLTVGDVGAFAHAMGARGVTVSAVADQGWGLATHVTLPSGKTMMVYEPRHAHAQ